MIADAKHQDECKAAEVDIDVTSLDELKKFNKDKKLIKNWAKKYSILIASEALVKKIPAVCGPTLNRIGMFPQPVSHNVPIKGKCNDMRATVKWQLKKVTCMNVAAGNEDMTDDQLRANITTSLNFLASLTKKGWHNIKTVNIKTTMGKAVKVL
jgi:large subunit ribosomal protein L10Ae